MRAADLFDFPESLPFGEVFLPDLQPWDWVKRIGEALESFDFALDQGQRGFPSGVTLSGDVYIHETVSLPPYAVIEGPVFIGPDCEIRPGAFIRGKVIAGRGCVLGNSCEYKNCLLLDNVETAHFNYVGDSVLGNGSHLGAGAILANLRLARDEVSVCTTEGRVNTGLRKLGAMLGDGAEIGCNAVLQPGTVLGRKSLVMPGVAFGGYLEGGKMARNLSRLECVKRPDLPRSP